MKYSRIPKILKVTFLKIVSNLPLFNQAAVNKTIPVPLSLFAVHNHRVFYFPYRNISDQSGYIAQ